MSGPIIDAANAINAKTSPAISRFAKLVAAKLEPPVTPAGKLIGFATGYPSGSSFDTQHDPATYVTTAKGLGANVLRFDADNDLAGFTARLQTLEAAGMKAVVIPAFLTGPATYAARCVALVNAARQHPGVVAYWELGNELNLAGPRLTPSLYVPWHRAAAAAIRQIDPAAKILTQGLAAWGQYGTQAGGGIDMVAYLEQCLTVDTSFGDWFAAVACHPYHYDAGDDVSQLEDQASPYSGVGAALSHQHSLLQVLDAHPSTAGKPLFFTEVGVDTIDVAETVQADYVGWLVDLVQAHPRLLGLGVYSLFNRPELTGREAYFGVDGKPAAAAFKTAVAA